MVPLFYNARRINEFQTNASLYLSAKEYHRRTPTRLKLLSQKDQELKISRMLELPVKSMVASLKLCIPYCPN